MCKFLEVFVYYFCSMAIPKISSFETTHNATLCFELRLKYGNVNLTSETCQKGKWSGECIKSSNYQIIKLSNYQTIKLSNYQIIKLCDGENTYTTHIVNANGLMSPPPPQGSR